MCLKVSPEFSQLEAWLSILLSTYEAHPSGSLAKTINYYLERILHHDDIYFYSQKHCEYIVMQKFWRWQASH